MQTSSEKHKDTINPNQVSFKNNFGPNTWFWILFEKVGLGLFENNSIDFLGT